MKQTLYFGNPAYLSIRNSQLVIKMPEVENAKSISDEMKQNSVTTKPIEDIGVLIIDHKQITLTSALISALLDNNCAVVTCNAPPACCYPSAVIPPKPNGSPDRYRHHYP